MENRKALRAVRVATFGMLVTALGVQQADAQRPGRVGGPRGGGGIGSYINGPVAMHTGPARSVEQAIRLADELGLSEAQRGELDALRQEHLAEQTNAAARLLELGSEVRAGIREPEALRQEMEALREVRRSEAEGVRDRLQQVLTEEQVQELQELSRSSRARLRGRRMQRGQRNFQRRRGRGQGSGAW